MTAEEFRAALAELDGTQEDLAQKLGVEARSVRRWAAHGCRKHIAVVMDALLRLKRAGLPWRKNEVAIGISSDGRAVQLSDAQAIRRHRAIMQDHVVTILHAPDCPVWSPDFFPDVDPGKSRCTCDFMSRLLKAV